MMSQTKLHHKLLLLLLCGTLVHCGKSEENEASNNTTKKDMTSKDQGSNDLGTKDMSDTDMKTDPKTDMSDDATKDMPSTCADIQLDKSDLGGDRPAKIYYPAGYDPCKPAPLVVLLHGYSATGRLQNAYFRLSRQSAQLGYVLIVPDGMTNADNKQFWNASEACCDFEKTGVDDVAYLRGLIEETKKRTKIDDKRVYLIGHSNGGFMSYKMACEASDIIAGIVSLAGAAQTDPSKCNPEHPVSILQIHGTNDGTIAYTGGTTTRPYPSANESVTRWVKRNGCDEASTEGTPLTLLNDSTETDTTVLNWKNCKSNTDVTLWTIPNGSHIPALKAETSIEALRHVFAHPKPD